MSAVVLRCERVRQDCQRSISPSWLDTAGRLDRTEATRIQGVSVVLGNSSGVLCLVGGGLGGLSPHSQQQKPLDRFLLLPIHSAWHCLRSTLGEAPGIFRTWWSGASVYINPITGASRLARDFFESSQWFIRCCFSIPTERLGPHPYFADSLFWRWCNLSIGVPVVG